MEWWQIYLLTRLESLSIAFGVLIAVSIVLLLVSSIGYLINYDGPTLYSFDDQESKNHKIEAHSKIVKLLFRVMKTALTVCVVCGFFQVAIPTPSQIAVIIAGHWATHNAEMQKLPDNVLKTLNGLLEKAQEEIK